MDVTKHKVGERASGEEIFLTSYSFGSGKPRVYIQAGIHGGELGGVEVVRRLLGLDLIKGSVVLVGLANPLAFEQRVYHYTSGKFSFLDGKDFNRVFPGKENGSYAERLACVLFSLARGSDVVIDLHTTRRSVPFGIACFDRNLELLKKSCTLGYFSKPVEGTLNFACEQEGIACLTLEVGSHDSLVEGSLREGVAMVRRVLSSLGMVKEDVLDGKIFEKIKVLRSEFGGYGKSLVAAGESFSRGEPLFELTSFEDLTRSVVLRAPQDGVVVKNPATAIFATGDPLIEFFIEG